MELDTQAVLLFSSDTAEATLTTAELKDKGVSARVAYRLQAKEYAGFVIPFLDAEEENLSENFLVDFEIQGTPTTCRLECKLVTDNGTGVWWVLTPEFRITSSWQRVQYKRRHFHYAWGASQHFLKGATQVEVVLTALEPLEGEFSVRNFSISPIASGRISAETSVIKVSSGEDSASGLLKPGHTTPWVSDEQQAQHIEITSSSSVELGAVFIHWGSGYASSYDLELKDAERGYYPVEKVRNFAGGVSYHYLAGAECEGLRLRLLERRGDARYRIKRIEFHGPAFAVTWNDFLARRAERAPAGYYPRYLSGEQSHWSIVAGDGSKEKGLINEEGLVELGYNQPSLDVFLKLDGKLFTWNETKQEQFLAKDYLPLPYVRRSAENFELLIRPWMETQAEQERIFVSYRLKNNGAVRLDAELTVAVRPFQVNPPWQFLNTTGGHVSLRSLQFTQDADGNRAALINNQATLASLTPVSAYAALNYWHGEVAEFSLSEGAFQEGSNDYEAAEDERGMCSGVFQYLLSLEPGEEREIKLSCAYSDKSARKKLADNGAEGFSATQSFWEKRLAGIRFDINAAQELSQTVKSQLGYILANRDGSAIQPGTRCYRRSWIRDGAMTSSALLQFGFFREVREFIEWFAPYVGDDGAVPCVVDANGVDTTPEHDSHGEFLFLVSEYYRYTKDAGIVHQLLPKLMKVVKHISELLDSTVRPELASYTQGLLPKSISHEGYAAGPAYSYWDNFWALLGLERLTNTLESIAANCEAETTKALHRRLEEVLRSSIADAIAAHGIDFIPGAADLGDFDATSTTIGVDPGNVLQTWFPAALETTFERYWSLFTSRLADFKGDQRYTPYELRVVGTLLRIGRPERALEALEFFMRHRRPSGWRHWAEVVWADERYPGFIGDAPHGWVASDFLRSVRALFAYESAEGWIFAAGVPLEWWQGGIACDIYTPQGLVSWRSAPADAEGEIEIELNGPTELKAELRLPGTSGSTKISLPFRSTVSIALSDN